MTHFSFKQHGLWFSDNSQSCAWQVYAKVSPSRILYRRKFFSVGQHFVKTLYWHFFPSSNTDYDFLLPLNLARDKVTRRSLQVEYFIVASSSAAVNISLRHFIDTFFLQATRTMTFCKLSILRVTRSLQVEYFIVSSSSAAVSISLRHIFDIFFFQETWNVTLMFLCKC